VLYQSKTSKISILIALDQTHSISHSLYRYLIRMQF